MNAAHRRQEIFNLLEAAGQPVSATALAARFSVSRQIIVSDIALLRAGGAQIMATPRGYLISAFTGIQRQIVCCHDSRRMEQELNTIVDLGCTILDVAVEHPIYGKLTGELRISCRADVALFLEKVQSSAALPLSVLTEGVHIHTLSCPSEEAFARVTGELKKLGVLVNEG